MKNWLSLLILVSFIRLQFVCCCGSIEHGMLERSVAVSGDECCQPKGVSRCCCGCDAAEKNAYQVLESSASLSIGTRNWPESSPSCECPLCKKGHSHLLHLFTAQHLRIASQAELRLDSLVLKNSLPSDILPDVKRLDSPRIANREIDATSGVSILYQLGRVLI